MIFYLFYPGLSKRSFFLRFLLSFLGAPHDPHPHHIVCLGSYGYQMGEIIGTLVRKSQALLSGDPLRQVFCQLKFVTGSGIKANADGEDSYRSS